MGAEGAGKRCGDRLCSRGLCCWWSLRMCSGWEDATERAREGRAGLAILPARRTGRGADPPAGRVLRAGCLHASMPIS